jgi:FdhE protein
MINGSPDDSDSHDGLEDWSPEPACCAQTFALRAERAEALCERAPEAAEALTFAAGLSRAQKRATVALDGMHTSGALTGDLARDVTRVLTASEAVLFHAAEVGPPALTARARELLDDEPATARARLLACWNAERPADEDYLARAMLQPYTAFLRSVRIAPDRPRARGSCPFCGGRPWITVRRGGSALEGARRMLVCALCAGEWPIGRVLCPSCAEANPTALPVFASGKHPAARIEACETCKRYVKSIDLSLDAHALPEIDDLASLTLDFWAREQGFERLEPGLAGL